MKLRTQVLAVVSPIIILGLLSFALTSMLWMKERKEDVFANIAKQAHEKLINHFSVIFAKNDNEVFLLSNIDRVNKLLHKALINEDVDDIKNPLNDALSAMYNKETAIAKTHWRIILSDKTELANIKPNNSSDQKKYTAIPLLPEETEQKTFRRLELKNKELRAFTIFNMTELLIARYGGETSLQLYVFVSRKVEAPFDHNAEFNGIVHSAISIDKSLKVFSPINNPVRDDYSAEQLLRLKSDNQMIIYRNSWSDFDVITISDLSYAINWPELIFPMVFALIIIGMVAIGIVLLVLNKAVITPVTWLAQHTKTGDVFNKPDQYPPLGSFEMKALYKGVIQSTRRLELVRTAMEEASLIDELTGLGNRRQFRKTLSKVVSGNLRKNSEFALLLIDLDNFKYVNDAYGHDVGDKLLTKFAHMLNQQTRSDDSLFNIVGQQHVSRLGGDEFAIILNDITSPTNSALVAERIIYEMNQGIFVDGVQMPVTSSIGIAVYPNDADNSNDLMVCVDAAMYKAKNQGKNGYYFYSKQIASQLAKELEIERELRTDFAAQKLELYVQPYFFAETLELAGGEVLLRWYNEKLGMVSPAEFIPIAEKVGLIREIDIWVIEQVCKNIQSTKVDKGINLSGLAINISALETRNPKFALKVDEILRKYEVNPESIELEITETALIEDLDAAAMVTSQLKEMGTKVALDDFGTGYSSISHLKDVKFDKLKIDRSFIIEIDDKKDAFLVADISLLLAHGMGMKITAEGVETESQLNYLKLSGCHYVQGFMFAKPMPMFEYIRLIESKTIEHN